MTQNSQASTKGRPPVGFDIDLPLSNSDDTFSILFCGFPARSTGIVNLRLLTGTTAHVLAEKRPAKESDGGSSSGGTVYRMCDTANLPLGCFHVKAGRNYWVMRVDSSATRPSSMVLTPLSQQRQQEQQGGGGGGGVPAAVAATAAVEDKDEEENTTLADLLLRSTQPSQAETRASRRESKRARKHRKPQTGQEEQTAVPGATTGVHAPHTTTAADGRADSADPLVSEIFTAMEAAGKATESHFAAAAAVEEADVVADVEASLADLFVSPPPHVPAVTRANVTAAAAEEKPAEPTARKRSRTERHAAKAAEMAASLPAVQDGGDGVTAEADTAKKPPKKRQKEQQGEAAVLAAVADSAPPPPPPSPSATTAAEGAEAPPATPPKHEKRAAPTKGTRVRDGPLPPPPSPSPSLDDSPLPVTATPPPPQQQPRRPAVQPALPVERAEVEKASAATAPSPAGEMRSPAIRPPPSPHRVDAAPAAVVLLVEPSSRSPAHSETSPTVPYSNRSSGPVTAAPLTSPHLRRHQQQFSDSGGGGGGGGKEGLGGWSPPGTEVGSAGAMVVLQESPALGFTQVQNSLAEEFSLDPSASVSSSNASMYYFDMEE